MEALLFNVKYFYNIFSLTKLNLRKVIGQVDNGFLEAIVRGYKAGILSPNQYSNLAQCEILEGMSSDLQ